MNGQMGKHATKVAETARAAVEKLDSVAHIEALISTAGMGMQVLQIQLIEESADRLVGAIHDLTESLSKVVE